jgi:hypothetical protein
MREQNNGFSNSKLENKKFKINSTTIILKANQKHATPLLNAKVMCIRQLNLVSGATYTQSVFESSAEILTTSYWLHVELGKNI